jgi:hypothetical protein
MAPTTNTMPMSNSVPRRPRCSASQLHVSAPMTAPTRIEAAINCSQPLPMSKSSPICNSAPEMIPVS